MTILLTAATPFEVAPTLSHLEQAWQSTTAGVFTRGNTQINVLITGVGLTATAFALGRVLHSQAPDWVLNAGIAGAIDRKLTLGEVVQVVSEQFADLGVEEADGRFTDLFALGLTADDQFPFVQQKMINRPANEAHFLPAVQGVSVNKVHGTAASIAALQANFPEAQVETMEGAAFFYACMQAQVPFVAIRSISNYVEPRNRAAWQISLAIERLNNVLIEMLETL